MPNIAKLREKGKVKGLIKALHHRDGEVRAEAAISLGAMHDTRALGPLLEALHDQEPTVRESAASALGSLGDVNAVDALLAALADPETTVREGAARGLGRLADSRALDPLVDALQDPDAGVRRAAASQLGNFCDDRRVGRPLRRRPAPAALIDALCDDDPGVRMAAAFSLSQFRDPRVVAALEATLRDRDPEVRANIEPMYAIVKRRQAEEVERAEYAGGTSIGTIKIEGHYEPAQVNAMLAVYVHEPGTQLSDLPSGDRLNEIAAAALDRHVRAMVLSKKPYVRTVTTSGGQPLTTQQIQAIRDAPTMMTELLEERGLKPYLPIEVWNQDLAPGVKVVWVAAR